MRNPGWEAERIDSLMLDLCTPTPCQGAEFSSSFGFLLLPLWQIYNSFARPYPRRFVLPVGVDPSIPAGQNLNPLLYTSATAVKEADGKVCAAVGCLQMPDFTVGICRFD